MREKSPGPARPRKPAAGKTAPGKPAPRRAAPAKPAARVAEMPSEDAIRVRAYQIWLERGCGAGQEIENWLQAERELSLTGRRR